MINLTFCLGLKICLETLYRIGNEVAWDRSEGIKHRAMKHLDSATLRSMTETFFGIGERCFISSALILLTIVKKHSLPERLFNQAEGDLNK